MQLRESIMTTQRSDLTAPQIKLLRSIAQSFPLVREQGDAGNILTLVRLGAARLAPPYNTYFGLVPQDAKVIATPAGLHRLHLLGV